MSFIVIMYRRYGIAFKELTFVYLRCNTFQPLHKYKKHFYHARSVNVYLGGRHPKVLIST